MKSLDKNSLIEEIDKQLEHLRTVRALFPYLDDNAIGKKNFNTAPYYQNLGFNINFGCSKKLERADVDKINSTGHWINQNYVIRIYSLLEEHNVLSNKIGIDKNIDGWKEVDLIRRLRHKFAHSKGRYNPKNKDSKELYEQISKHFSLTNIKPPSKATEFPLSIDKVLEPLTAGCKKYISNLDSKNLN